MTVKHRLATPANMNVVAELTITSPEGVEIVRSFDTAYHRALELPVPVNIKLNGFVRKD